MIIHTIPSLANEQKKRVAAYARVSTTQENQEDSFENQVKYFTEYIQRNPRWEMVDVYSDEGISGLSAERRPGFMRMISDAEDGKIDLILVKSISRFGRNSMEAQTYMHQLKSKGIEVRFERDGISSFDPTAEMIFNFLVIIAQEESRSISMNVRWAFEKMAEQGIRHVGNNHVLGYDEIDGQLVPNEKAPIVKYIYDLYDNGVDINQIIERLFEKGYKTHLGKERFARPTIRGILQNEIYKGDRLIQKKPHKNFLTHKPEVDAPYTSYYVEDDHEGIVTKEVWERVNVRLTEHYRKRDKPLERKSS